MRPGRPRSRTVATSSPKSSTCTVAQRFDPSPTIDQAVNGVFPDYKAPIVRTRTDGRELATARWGMPSSSKALMDATKKRAEKLQAKGKTVDFKELLRMEPDGGTTNIRNVKSKHWTRWLGPEHRCVVPFNSFSEFNKAEGGGHLMLRTHRC